MVVDRPQLEANRDLLLEQMIHLGKTERKRPSLWSIAQESGRTTALRVSCWKSEVPSELSALPGRPRGADAGLRQIAARGPLTGAKNGTDHG